MSFTHPRRLQKRIQSRAERDKSEDSGKEVFKACAQNISWNFTETTSYYPTQCLSTRRRRGKNEIKKNRKNATKRNLQVEEEKTLKSLSEEDLEWRLSGATSGTTVFH